LSRFYWVKTGLYNALGVRNGCDCEDRHLLRFEAAEPDGHLFRKYKKKGD
jgi:hypothetical protein